MLAQATPCEAGVYYLLLDMATPKIPHLAAAHRDPEWVPVDSEEVLAELGRILQSRHFRSCKQGKRFLRYIVEQTLRGNAALLKERLLGAALFDRPPDYATGEDSVVRVQANDVRRRLAAYRAESPQSTAVIIELPVGTYVPSFRKELAAEAAPAEKPNASRIAEPSDGMVAPPGPQLAALPPREREAEGASSPSALAPSAVTSGKVPTRSTWNRALFFFLLGAALAGSLAFLLANRGSRPRAVPALSDKLSASFWEPLLSSPSPVVICLGKTAVYRPSDNLYRRYTRNHPGEFLTNNERLTRALPLAPTDPLRWGDLVAAYSYGFTIGSVRSAVDLAGFLARQQKGYDMRLGVESSFADLRNFPAVLVGAFNNRWTMELNSDLHFTYSEDSGQPGIRERVSPNRSWTWQLDPAGNVLRDYGIVTRQRVWKTGQSVISVGGIGDGGTEAATEMVTRPEELARVLQSLPEGWEKKDLQVVVATDITDGEAGRPRLVAYAVW